MSYRSEDCTSSSSYRKTFGDSPRHASSSSRTTMSFSLGGGYRSPSVSRSNVSMGSSNRFPGLWSGLTLETFDPIQRSLVNPEVKMICTNEKEQMQGLNDRFAMFIEKVRQLEQSNKVQETELITLRMWKTEPSRLAEVHQQQFHELSSQVEVLYREKSQLVLERDCIEGDLLKLKGMYEEEYRAREDAEFTLKVFKKDVDDATMVRLDLEKKVESLRGEIKFLNKEHKQEVADLMVIIKTTKEIREKEVSKLDLTSAFKEIRAQYESIASRNLQVAVEWFETKIAELTEQATQSTETIHASREEMNESRRQLQCKTIEMESLRGTNESLEKQIYEAEERHNVEIRIYEDKMVGLDNEMRTSKSSIARHVREYQDLLNVKMALDMEIEAYRRLLEGGESHIGTGITYSGSSRSTSIGKDYYQNVTITSNSSMREGKDEDQQQIKLGGKVYQREVYKEPEETVVIDAMGKQQNKSGGKVIVEVREVVIDDMGREVITEMEREVIDAMEKQQSKSGGKVSQREVYEETVVTTTKETEK